MNGLGFLLTFLALILAISSSILTVMITFMQNRFNTKEVAYGITFPLITVYFTVLLASSGVAYYFFCTVRGVFGTFLGIAVLIVTIIMMITLRIGGKALFDYHIYHVLGIIKPSPSDRIAETIKKILSRSERIAKTSERIISPTERIANTIERILEEKEAKKEDNNKKK